VMLGSPLHHQRSERRPAHPETLAADESQKPRLRVHDESTSDAPADRVPADASLSLRPSRAPFPDLACACVTEVEDQSSLCH
jgi:hypothetical protein